MFDLEHIKNSTNIASIDFQAQLNSTNDRAIDRTRSTPVSFPLLVLTETQTAGRGQRDKKWWSGDGSLTFSWVISDANWSGATNRNVSLIPATVALAVADAIEQSSELQNIRLKWPNDLIVVNRKISGILIESVSIASEKVFVVGIGINVNNPEITSRQVESPGHGSMLLPTSIFVETKKKTSLEKLLIAIVRQLESEFERLATQPATIVEHFNKRIFCQDKEIRIVTSSGAEHVGICEGISPDGGLILKTVIGTEVVYSGIIQAD